MKKGQATLVNKIATGTGSAALLLSLLGGGATFAWCKLARPDIDERIDIKQKGIIEALEYQNFLKMETMTDEQVNAAEKKYLSFKKGSPK